MPRRAHEQPLENEPPRKKSSSLVANIGNELKQGEIIKDITGKKWKLGKTVGIGGFGEIYLATDGLHRDVKTDTHYVAKIERHTSGPLFVEVICYLKIAKLDMIEEWKKINKLKHLGMPHYVAFGSHMHKGEKYRFLIIPRFEKDLEAIFQAKKAFNFKTIVTIAIQIIDVLEYIHSHGYIHSDIKASNIMLGKPVKNHDIVVPSQSSKNLRHVRPSNRARRNLRSVNVVTYVDDIPYLEDLLDKFEKGCDMTNDTKTIGEDVEKDNQIYLLDYGLAAKYQLSNGETREFSTDERRAHAGTVLFCSRDAHKGIQSRRSDLESLAYNMVYWATGRLPWSEDVDQPDIVEKKKNQCFYDLRNFLAECFPNGYPNFLYEFLNYLNTLQEKPDYESCRCLFKRGLRELGYTVKLNLDFDNVEGWGKPKKPRENVGRENRRTKRFGNISPILISPRPPLQSNNIIYKRPKLRKKKQNKSEPISMLNWSRILIDDPEELLKQARERKNTESSDGGISFLTDEELASMNPTYAMIEVYNKSKERADGSPKYKVESGVDLLDGYTPAMMNVYQRIQERVQMEYEAVNNNNNIPKSNHKSSTSVKLRSSSRRKLKPESPVKSTRASKSSTVVSQKKESVKKVKSVPTRRIYSLRG